MVLEKVLCIVGEANRPGVMPEGKTKQFIALINHPHNDKENGQPRTHYHGDSRFDVPQPHLPEDWHMRMSGGARITIKEDGSFQDFGGYYKMYLEEIELYRNDETQKNKTTLDLITNSKLKHKCMHKGKCPHRGYDLTNEKPVDGIITCPLHGLQFDAETFVLLTDMSKVKPHNPTPWKN